MASVQLSLEIRGAEGNPNEERPNFHEEALQVVDEPTFRVWRLFMSGSAYGFRIGRLNVYQALLIKPDRGGQSGLPLTRADWYADM